MIYELLVDSLMPYFDWNGKFKAKITIIPTVNAQILSHFNHSVLRLQTARFGLRL